MNGALVEARCQQIPGGSKGQQRFKLAYLSERKCIKMQMQGANHEGLGMY